MASVSRGRGFAIARVSGQRLATVGTSRLLCLHRALDLKSRQFYAAASPAAGHSRVLARLRFPLPAPDAPPRSPGSFLGHGAFAPLALAQCHIRAQAQAEQPHVECPRPYQLADPRCPRTLTDWASSRHLTPLMLLDHEHSNDHCACCFLIRPRRLSLV